MLDAIVKYKLFNSSDDLFDLSIDYSKIAHVPVSQPGLYDDYQSLMIGAKCDFDLKIIDPQILKESQVTKINQQVVKLLDGKCKPVEGVVLDSRKQYNVYLQITYHKKGNVFSLNRLNGLYFG